MSKICNIALRAAGSAARKRFGGILLLLGVGAVSAWGAGITVSEPPDFPDSGGPVLTLGLGTNTITGSVNGCPITGCGGTDYKDQFVVDVPAGLLVSSASYMLSNLDFGGGFSPTGACVSGQGCFGGGGGGGDIPVAGMTSIFVESPWSSDIGGNGLAGFANYIFTINTVLSTEPGGAAPEPSTWLLSLAGVVAVVAHRKVKRPDAECGGANR